MVAVPPDLDDEPTRTFNGFTGELQVLVQWLIGLGITTVAMESTGIYWIPLYEMLNNAGLEVYLVNARHVRTVPGRKTDVNDAQWLQQVHSYGLLQASFLPDRDIGELRAYVRVREQLTRARASIQQQILNALMQMNLQLQHVVSDVVEPRLFCYRQNSLLICERTTTSMPRLIDSMLSFWHVFHHSIRRVSTMNADLALLSP